MHVKHCRRLPPRVILPHRGRYTPFEAIEGAGGLCEAGGCERCTGRSVFRELVCRPFDLQLVLPMLLLGSTEH